MSFYRNSLLVKALILIIFNSTQLLCVAQSNKTLDSLRRIGQRSTNDTTLINGYISLAISLHENNRLDSALLVLNEALSNCEKALQTLKNVNYRNTIEKQKVMVLNNQAKIFRKKGDTSKALEVLEQCLYTSQSIGYKSGEAWALYQIGDVYDYLGDLKGGLDYYQKSLEIFVSIDESMGKGKLLNSIGTIYDYRGELDKAMHYYKEALEVYEKINDIRGIADQYNNIGVIHYLKGDYIDALSFYNRSAEINKSIISNKHVYAMTINNIGLVYDNLGDLMSALEYYNKSLKIFESLEFGSGIVLPINNLGDAYSKMGDFNKAQEHYLRSLKICEDLNDEQGKAYTLEKICTLYTLEKKFEEGEHFCQGCIETYNQIGDAHGIALSSSAYGKFNQERGDYKNALKFFQKSLNAYETIGDRQGIAKSYYNIGNILFKQKQVNRAFEFTYKAYSIAKEFNFPNEISLSAYLLSLLYRKQNDYTNALKFFEEHVLLRNQIDNDEVRRTIQEQYYRLQYEKKAASDSITYAQEMAIKNLELDKKREQTRRQQWIIYSIVIGLIGLIVFAFILMQLLAAKRLANQKLEQINEEVNQQNEEITCQRDEIETQRNLLQEQNSMLEQANTEISAQRDMVMIQKEKLEEAHTHITESLSYAQSIQAAILPSEMVLKQISPDYFVLVKPCELVSGDFFWATSFDNYHIFCVADCTGHGVPGAFMSILGITALNDIVVKNRLTMPSEILGLLRVSVIEALGQNDPDHLHKDGLDIAMCVFDTKTRTLNFSGAGIPLWIVLDKVNNQVNIENSDEVILLNNFALYEIKGDSMPVGQSPVMKPFSNKTFALLGASITIYLATDGFSDQFDGDKKSKFSGARLKKIILENCTKPLSIQKGILDSEFTNWKGNNYQVDDVTVLGIKI
jgi:tetratricopeptide (TPR) repeat protein/serine phosphatase RsbU (regulator of sigma subunit)